MAEPPEFKQPASYSPENVVGDTIDEVVTPFKQPARYEPDPPDSLFVQGPNLQPHEHTSPFVEPTHHVPALVIGDTLDEVQQPPPLSVPAAIPPPGPFAETPMPPPASPASVMTPDPHEPPVDPPNEPRTDYYVPPTEPLNVPRTDLYEAQDDPSRFEEPDRHRPSNIVQEPQLGQAAKESDRSELIPRSDVEAGVERRHVPRTAVQIFEHLKRIDAKLVADIFQGNDEFAPGPGIGSGARASDPILHAKIYMNYLKMVGPSGVATFTALQTVLHAMNKKYGRVFNPFYLSTPLMPGLTPVTLDQNEKVHTEFAQTVGENAAYLEANRPSGIMKPTLTMNSYNETHPYTEGSVLNHTDFVDIALGTQLPGLAAAVPTTNVSYGNGIYRRHVDRTKMFDSSGKLLPRYSADSPDRDIKRENEILTQSSFNWKGSRGAVPASMDAYDDEYGYVTEPLGDDMVYMPFVVQDLRPDPQGKKRHVYFRAFNLNTSEQFTPNWSEEEGWGRVDPVMGYRSTGRAMSISFYCHAFAPEDLSVIYKKRNWLTSMVYPEISSDLLMRSGPVCRMRVGDLYNNAQGGLPGVIKDLSFDDSEQVWELKQGFKVPRGFNVSFTFQVLHEGTPGIHEGHFTTMRSTIPQRRNDDSSRNEGIKVEPDDTMFAKITPPRKKV